MNLDGSLLPSGSKPAECEVRPMSNTNDLHLMVHSSQKKQYGLKGKFGMRGVAIPPAGLMNELIAKRTETLEAKKRENEVKPDIDPKKRKDPLLLVQLDPDQAEYVYGPTRGVVEERRRREKGEKRVRADYQEVLRMILEKFNEQKYWTVRALGMATQQPEQYLKSVLEEVAVMITSGPYKGQYMLKP